MYFKCVMFKHLVEEIVLCTYWEYYHRSEYLIQMEKNRYDIEIMSKLEVLR